MTKLQSFHFQNLPGQLAQIAEDKASKASKEERKTFLHDHMASHMTIWHHTYYTQQNL